MSDDENAEDIVPRECIESVRVQMFRMIPERGYHRTSVAEEIGHEFSTKDGVSLPIINGTNKVGHSLALISSWGFKSTLASRYPTLSLQRARKEEP